MPSMTIRFKNIILRTLKWGTLIVAVFILLLISLFLLIQTRFGQDLLRDQAVKYLSGKLKTRVEIGQIDLDLKKGIRISNLLIEDQEKRTLAKIGVLDVEIDILPLLSKQATIRRIELKNTDINIFREAGSDAFNFSFIPDAFSSGTEEVKTLKDSSASFLIRLGEIDLETVNFLMDDKYGKQKHSVALGSLIADLTLSDVSRMKFRAKHLHTRDLRTNINFWSTDEPAGADSSSATAMSIRIDTASLARTSFDMFRQQGHMNIHTNAGLLTTSSLTVNLTEQYAKAVSVYLKDHTTDFDFVSGPATNMKQVPEPPSTPFRFSVDTLAIIDNGFSFNDNAHKRSENKKAVDPYHLQLSDINIHLASTSFDGKIYRSMIKTVNAKESSGLTLKQLGGEVEYDESDFRINNLLLQTSQNTILASVLVKGLQSEDKEQIGINGAISSKGLQLQELLYFQPTLAQNKYFAPLATKRFDLNTRFEGTIGNLHIRELLMKESRTSVSASADILHVTDPDKMIVNLNLNRFQSGRNDVLALLPKGLIEDSLLHYIPKDFSVSGTYRGTIKDFNTDLKLATSLGNLKIKGNIKHVTDPSRAAYNISTSLDAVDVGKILEDTSFGKVSGIVQAKGRGYELKTALADVEANITKATYNGYEYGHIALQGSVKNGQVAADIFSSDPNLDLDGKLSIDLSSDAKKIDADLDIRNLDLLQLHFFTDSLVLKGKIAGHFPEISTEKIIGELDITNSIISYNHKLLALDSIALSARHVSDSQFIDLKTPYSELSLKGQYSLQELPDVAKKIINKYVIVGSPDTVYEKAVQATLNMTVNIPDTVASLIDGLKSVSPFRIDAAIDTRTDQLNFWVVLPAIKYKDLEIDSASTFATTVEGINTKALLVGARVLKVQGPSFKLNETNAGFTALNGILDGVLLFNNGGNDPRYKIPFVITNDPLRPYISIKDSLLIDKKPWSVNRDNRIYLNPEQLEGSTIALSYRNTMITLKALGNELDGLPLELDIRNFNISDITDILIADTSLATGIVNGKTTLSSFSPLSFETSITADSLTAYGTKLGSLAVEVSNKDSGMMILRSSLTGETGNVALSGTYYTETKLAELDLDLKELHLAHAEPFVRKYLSGLNGRMNGSLKIRGSLDEPEVRGQLNADSVEAVYRMTATYLRIPKATWTFNDKGVVFDRLVIEDSLGHKGILDGQINTKNYRDLAFDLNLKADSFEVVGRKKIADQGIYGPTKADINIRMNGTNDHMNVEGKVNIIDRSEFTYVYRSEMKDQIGDGLVEFFDPLKPIDTLTAEKNSKPSLGSTMDMNLYINITPGTTVTVITDEISGDHLKAKGKADLNYIMKSGGGMELLGTYILDGGEYDLSLAGLIRKSFKIEKGSTITWSGDPMKGRMDITAKYETKAAAGPLLNDMNHIPGIDKQKLKFDVMILLKKELLKPDIAFRLDMPESDQQAFDGMVYSRIKQVNAIPAELNKQVMGLLAFGQFIAENPFNSLTSAGGDFQSQAFNTAGKLLTQELTNLVGRYIKEVNIDFGLEKEKDYTSGSEVNRTDFKVGVSKSFANNRLNIYVGSNFALEGANQNQDAISGIAGDITLEYLLSPDGKYRLKGYRLTDNELVFQGNVVRTGVSFVVVLEFNKFKNMFKAKKN
jgi:translocation and assembly module TamB